MSWTTADIPSQHGKLAIVTGANSGIGYETALALAKAGAQVIIACRTEAKGFAVVKKIRTASPAAKIHFEALDLSDLSSVSAFAKHIKDSNQALHLLINNAGVMAPPKRRVTVDGFELQLGTNYLGHFALTGLLLPLLVKAESARVVQLSSIAHRSGKIDLDDLQSSRRYKPWPAYSQSKLAMLMFALELQRRSKSNDWGLLSVAAHPGVARTELLANGPGNNSPTAVVLRTVGRFFTQTAAQGALPVLMAATSPGVKLGSYYGSTGFMEMTGPPGLAKIAPQSLDKAVAAQLWAVSEKLTGVTFKAAR